MMGGSREKNQLQIPDGQRGKNDYFDSKGGNAFPLDGVEEGSEQDLSGSLQYKMNSS